MLVLRFSAAPCQPKAALLATPMLLPPHPSHLEPMNAEEAVRLRLLQPRCKLKEVILRLHALNFQL